MLSRRTYRRCQRQKRVHKHRRGLIEYHLELSQLQTIAMETATSATRHMQYERLEWEDYGIIADHVERLGVLSALGVLPPLPHQRELLDGLAAFVEKRHHRGRLREELDRVRSAHPLWSQPFCLQLLEIAFGRG